MIKLNPNQVRTSVATMVLAASTLVGIAVHEGYREDAYFFINSKNNTININKL